MAARDGHESWVKIGGYEREHQPVEHLSVGEGFVEFLFRRLHSIRGIPEGGRVF